MITLLNSFSFTLLVVLAEGDHDRIDIALGTMLLYLGLRGLILLQQY